MIDAQGKPMAVGDCFWQNSSKLNGIQRGSVPRSIRDNLQFNKSSNSPALAEGEKCNFCCRIVTVDIVRTNTEEREQMARESE